MKPIIMSTEDVRSLLDGRKTMARKAIKFPGDYFVHRYDGPEDNGMHLFAWGHVMPTLHVQVMGVKQTGGVTFCDGYYEVKAPCQPGDVLWVRETFARHNKGIAYKADSDKRKIKILKGFWEPPLHMPREAARLFLRVTDVRVERVQNIAEKDAESEGFRTECGPLSSCPTCNVSEFHKTWDARNAKRGYGWDTNPFCWVIEFKRVEKGEES